MKKLFYKNYYYLLSNFILSVIYTISMVFFNIFFRISYTSMGYAVYWFWVSELVMLLSFIEPFIIGRKKNLSKVLVDETGIQLVYKKEVLESHQWFEIEDIIKASRIRHQELKFTLISKSDGYNNDILYFNVDRKIKEALLFYCSNEEIREKIEKVKLLY